MSRGTTTAKGQHPVGQWACGGTKSSSVLSLPTSEALSLRESGEAFGRSPHRNEKLAELLPGRQYRARRDRIFLRRFLELDRRFEQTKRCVGVPVRLG